MGSGTFMVCGLLLCSGAVASEPVSRAAVARWDGRVVEEGERVDGMTEPARRSIETWRVFAENRGYRIDLDERQGVLVLSDADRFRHYRASATIVERIHDELDRFGTADEVPVVILRASSEAHLQTALRAAEALGFSDSLTGYVEDAPLTARRHVDARLAEAIVELQLGLEEPHLSTWMVDGLASLLAEKTTGRAIVDGEIRTLRSVQTEVARLERNATTEFISLYEISGVRIDDDTVPLETYAMAVFGFLDRYHGALLPRIVAELGRREPVAGRSKYREEERSLERHLGPTALDQLTRALREGRGYRP